MTGERRILLFTKTAGYRHDSLPAGISSIQELSAGEGIVVEHTEDEGAFTLENLDRHDAVVWLQVSGDVLTETGRAAFADYLARGGGWAGIHGPADAEWWWPTYDDIVGARFRCHPTNGRQAASVIVRAEDPSTAALPHPWVWEDEWYAFEHAPGAPFTVLLGIDESTYDPEDGPMGENHPVAWRGTFGAGKTWYTSLGHHADSYSDERFRKHLWGGITSVLRH